MARRSFVVVSTGRRFRSLDGVPIIDAYRFAVRSKERDLLSIGAFVDKDCPSRHAFSTVGNNVGLHRLELADQFNLLLDVSGENCLNEQASRAVASSARTAGVRRHARTAAKARYR